jgi:hypothetical protein
VPAGARRAGGAGDRGDFRPLTKDHNLGARRRIIEFTVEDAIHAYKELSAEILWWGGSHPYHGVLVWSEIFK